ncbi:MAG: S49 family peptidase, partial [Cyanobacteria bacterium P01_E01_bin.43]
ELIDVSYGQFVKTVAKARGLTEETVRSFADGRIFTGEQALTLGVVDRLGTEEDARRWAAELADLDPEEAEVLKIEPKKTGIQRFVPGRNQSVWSQIFPEAAANLQTVTNWLEFEISTSGLPLWLYRP